MNTTAEQPIRFSDCILTMDARLWFSPSYRGMSSRSELWLTAMALSFVCGLMPLVLVNLGAYEVVWEEWGEVSNPLQLAFEGFFLLLEMLVFLPLLIRRARQMGAVWYGAFALALWVLPEAYSWRSYFLHGYFGKDLLCGVDACLNLLVLLPLFFFGGTFSGRKNGLHRAAMAGDEARIVQYLSLYPSMLLRKSEKGFTPHEYARLMGHAELAAWLGEKEAAAQKTAAE